MADEFPIRSFQLSCSEPALKDRITEIKREFRSIKEMKYLYPRAYAEWLKVKKDKSILTRMKRVFPKISRFLLRHKGVIRRGARAAL